MMRGGSLKQSVNHDAHPLIPARLSGHIDAREGKHGKYGEKSSP